MLVSRLSEHLVLPVHIREDVKHLTVLHCRNVGCRIAWSISVVHECLVQSSRILMVIGHLRHAERCLERVVVVNCDLQSVLDTLAGCDEKGSVSTTVSVKGKRCCVLEHLDALDLAYVKERKIASRYSVNHNKNIVSVKRAHASDSHGSRVIPWRASGLDRRKARNHSIERVARIEGVRYLELIAGNGICLKILGVQSCAEDKACQYYQYFLHIRHLLPARILYKSVTLVDFLWREGAEIPLRREVVCPYSWLHRLWIRVIELHSVV